MSKLHGIKPTTPRAFFTVEEVQSVLGIGRTAAYRLCRSDNLETVRVGRAIRVPPAALQRWIDQGGSPTLDEGRR